MDTIVTGASAHSQNAGNIQGNQQQTIENGNDGQMLTSTPIIKSEVSKVDSIVSMDPNSTSEMSMSTPQSNKTSKRNKAQIGNDSE